MIFTDAKIVGANIRQEYYRKQGVPRGNLDYVIGRSDLCEILTCPHRWLMGGTEDEPDTDATAWGTLMDAIVLSSNGGTDTIAIAPETYPGAKGEEKPWNWNATFCRDWRESQGDKIVVKSATWEKAEQAAKVLRADGQIAGLLEEAEFQVMVTGIADCGMYIPVKGLIDIVPAKRTGALADLKTTNCAASRAWARSVFSGGYHVQAALYSDLFNSAAKENRSMFYWPVQESSAPWEVVRRYISDGDPFFQIGRRQYEQALSLYVECLKSGVWPGYDRDTFAPDGWTHVDAEPWMIGQAGVNMGNGADILGTDGEK